MRAIWIYLLGLSLMLAALLATRGIVPTLWLAGAGLVVVAVFRGACELVK